MPIETFRTTPPALPACFDIGKRACNPLISFIDSLVKDGAILFLKPVFAIPDVHRCRLQRDGARADDVVEK